MRPSRIIVGEVRQEESLDLSRVLNAGDRWLRQQPERPAGEQRQPAPTVIETPSASRQLPLLTT
jgi:hypothetical protein